MRRTWGRPGSFSSSRFTSDLVFQWLPCHALSVIGSQLGLVGLVAVCCDWVRHKVSSAASVSVWQHVHIFGADLSLRSTHTSLGTISNQQSRTTTKNKQTKTSTHTHTHTHVRADQRLKKKPNKKKHTRACRSTSLPKIHSHIARDVKQPTINNND